MTIFKDKQYFRVKLEKEADEALWLRCKSCGELVFKKRVRENNNICPNCGEYFFLTARERIESLIDKESFEDVSKPIVADDPLGFQDEKPYPQRLEEAQEKTGLPSAIILGSASISQIPVVIGVMELTLQSRYSLSVTFQALEIYVMTSIYYFAICFPLAMGAQYLERRLSLEDR